MTKIISMLVFCFSWPVFAGEQVPVEIQKLAADFSTTMMECPQRIWSNYNWDGLKVVFIYPTKSDSWVWDVSSNAIKSIPNKDIPSEAIGSVFAFFNIGGQKTMSLKMEDKILEPFELGVHEFFHHIGQADWTNDRSGGRGTMYPLNGEPRFYRRMLYDHLKAYLQSGEQSSLGRAKYWFDKWTNEFTAETQSTTDGYEGTAEYVEVMAQAIATLGCSATEEQLQAFVTNKVVSDFGSSVDGENLALDSEGYEIGGVAAFALRFRGPDLSDWNHQVASGATPLEILLKSVEPISEEEPMLLRRSFIQAAQAFNDIMKSHLDDDIANWNHKDYVRVAVPYEWLQTNLMPKFFGRSTELDMELMLLASEHRFASKAEAASNFRLKENTVVFDSSESPCSDQSSFSLVPLTAIKLMGRTSNINTGGVVGRLVGDIKTSERGYHYFCLE